MKCILTLLVQKWSRFARLADHGDQLGCVVEGPHGDYVRAFKFGNEDVSGDPDKDNGLTNAWLSS